MKKILNLLIIASLCVATLLCITSCGEDEPTYADYKINVVDFMGNPISNVVATFTDAEGNTKKTITQKDGSASFKNFVVGENTVLLEKGLSDADIMQEKYTFADGVTEMRIILRNEKTSTDVVGEIADGQYAYSVGVGSHKVLTEANHTSYVIFNAPSSGIYKISFNSADTEMTVGYYGVPMYVQTSHRADGTYDGKSFELVIQDAGTPYVIGLNCKNTTDSTLIIERTGDAPFDPTHVAWTSVQSQRTDLKVCDTTGKTLVDMNIADPDLSVSLGDDGYYYTNDGKLVYVRITSVTGITREVDFQTYPILSGSIALLAGHVEDDVGSNFGGYIYDANGNFLYKHAYNDMIKTYMDYVDGIYGVVPLTGELAEGIKLHGNHNGWWNSESYGYLFEGVEVVQENAWLFLCMVEQ